MARVKRGSERTKKRRGFLSQTKGYYAGRKNLIKQAKTAVRKAGQRAYDHRRLKKRDRRALWQIKINAAARQHGTTYSRFIDALKKKQVGLDRKVLAQLAEYHPKVFEQLIAEVTKK